MIIEYCRHPLEVSFNQMAFLLQSGQSRSSLVLQTYFCGAPTNDGDTRKEQKLQILGIAILVDCRSPPASTKIEVA